MANHGNMTEYKQCSYSLHKAIKQAECQYRGKVELQLYSSDTRRMWQGLQTFMDYKSKTSHVTDTDVWLPDKLNTFVAHFKNNTDAARYQGLWALLLGGRRE